MNPFKKIFPYGKHFIDNEDIRSVCNVLRNKPITQGPQIKQTEQKIAKYVGSKYAVLVSSCSAGLHIACKALNVNKKTKVLTSPITFVSAAAAALHCGAKIILSDIDQNTINISENEIKKKIKNKKLM